jgi:hypothetical protein
VRIDYEVSLRIVLRLRRLVSVIRYNCNIDTISTPLIFAHMEVLKEDIGINGAIIRYFEYTPRRKYPGHNRIFSAISWRHTYCSVFAEY